MVVLAHKGSGKDRLNPNAMKEGCPLGRQPPIQWFYSLR